ncbi:MAG TPA: nicotinate phosphoribosyltransferase [Oscillospiraceae bacterium]|nr:nicotinate phosphoribosyltransferase [Oscillospiraceae bacterium]
MMDKRIFLAELCEYAVANGLISSKTYDTPAVFDVFFRDVPDSGGFAIMAGLDTLINHLTNLSFSEKEIDFLIKLGFDDDFVNYFKNFKFTCDVFAVPEGTPIFPNEPIIKIKGPIIQAQLIETMLLNTINFQTLIATKSNRIVRAAQGRSVAEVGARRAHGFDAAIKASRAAYIGGVDATSNFAAGLEYDLPMICTMSHSFVQMFESEYEAFAVYLKEHYKDAVVVVDTYDTLSSGVPNAIKAFDDVLLPHGFRPKAIMIDSGDMTYLSKRARRMLDTAGYADCEIIVSNSLDETLIRDMLIQGAKIDTFAVGEKLVTSQTSPIFNGVYKICEVEINGEMQPTIMVSDNVSKITTPCDKKLWRLFDMKTGKAIADVLTLANEQIDNKKPFLLFDPIFTWKRKEVDGFVARELLVPIIKGGKCVYNRPSLKEIRQYCKEQIGTLWEEVVRFENPHIYYVDLSEKLWKEKQRLIEYRAGGLVR